MYVCVQEYKAVKLAGLLRYTYYIHSERNGIFPCQFDPLHTPHLINFFSDLRRRITVPFSNVLQATLKHVHMRLRTKKTRSGSNYIRMTTKCDKIQLKSCRTTRIFLFLSLFKWKIYASLIFLFYLLDEIHSCLQQAYCLNHMYGFHPDVK